MNVLCCYLVTIFLISFCLTLFRYNLQFLIRSDFLFGKQIFKLFSASFMIKEENVSVPILHRSVGVD